MNLSITGKTDPTFKICLFGAPGFVGRSIGHHLDALGIEWVGVSRRSLGPNCRPLCSMSFEELRDLVEEYPIIINASGSLKPRDFVSDFHSSFEEFWQTLQDFVTLLSSARIVKLVHISSGGTVYGEAPEGLAHKETAITRSKSWYGRAKIIEENILAQLASQQGFDYVCARVSNPFGNPDAQNHGFIDVLATTILKGKVFTARFPERANRDFIYAPMMAEMLTNLALSQANGIYNIGSGVSTRLADILEHVETLYPNAKIVREYPDVRTDVVSMAISIEKYMDHFGRAQCQDFTPLQYLDFRLSHNQ